MNKDQTPLADCPFCGPGTDVEYVESEQCVNCSTCATFGPFGDTKSEAIAAWNRRSEVEAARAQTAAEPTNLHARILEALLDHGLQHTRDDDDAGLPLVDALTRRGDKDIRSGIEEIELLADAIFDAVEPLYASPSFPAPAPTVDAQWVETAIELAEDYGKCRWNSAASGAMFDKVSVRHADEEAAEALAALRAHLMTAAPAPGVEEGTGVPEDARASSLYQQIINLRENAPRLHPGQYRDGFLAGYKAARHDAAELVQANACGPNETSDAARPQGNGGANG